MAARKFPPGNPPIVTPRIRLILTIIVLWCLGVAGFHQLTVWSAPAHDQAAIFVGLLLASFGVVAAQFAMLLVVLPLAVLRMLGRVLQGRKPMVVNARERDPLDVLGRVMFVAGFTMLSATVGACAGFVADGHGLFASAAAFAAFGALLAILVPAELMFAADEDAGGTITEAQHADHEAARQAGVPAVLFADRVAKGLREQLFEDQRKP